MNISAVTGASAASAVSSAPPQQYGKHAETATQNQDSVQLSAAAQAQLKGADADGDHDGK
jgi:hypothetical protein